MKIQASDPNSWTTIKTVQKNYLNSFYISISSLYELVIQKLLKYLMKSETKNYTEVEVQNQKVI